RNNYSKSRTAWSGSFIFETPARITTARPLLVAFCFPFAEVEDDRQSFPRLLLPDPGLEEALVTIVEQLLIVAKDHDHRNRDGGGIVQVRLRRVEDLEPLSTAAPRGAKGLASGGQPD